MIRRPPRSTRTDTPFPYTTLFRSRGLYQDPQSDVDSEQTLAEVAKRIPKGVIAMVSALAYHGLTDQMPRKTWVAIGASDWSPVSDYPPVRIVRFAEMYLHHGLERHAISGVDVPVFSQSAERRVGHECVCRSKSSQRYVHK